MAAKEGEERKRFLKLMKNIYPQPVMLSEVEGPSSLKDQFADFWKRLLFEWISPRSLYAGRAEMAIEMPDGVHSTDTPSFIRRGPATAARRYLAGKENQWLAFAQDDGILREWSRGPDGAGLSESTTVIDRRYRLKLIFRQAQDDGILNL